MVARGDDRQHNDRRIQRTGDTPAERPGVAHDADPDAQRPARVQRGHCGDGIRKASETEARMHQADVCEPRRRRREEPVHHQRDHGRGQEAVAEDAERRPRAAVEPEEEHAREEEVADEVETVEGRQEPRPA